MLKAMFFIMTDEELATLGLKDKNVASFIAENADKAVQMSMSTEKENSCKEVDLRGISTWEDVLRYEGLYKVNRQGDIKNVRTGKLMAQTTGPTGYSVLKLSKGGRQTGISVHRIVLEAFTKKALPKGIQVKHKNGNKTDNSFGNLEPEYTLLPGYGLGVEKTPDIPKTISKAAKSPESKVTPIRERANGGREVGFRKLSPRQVTAIETMLKTTNVRQYKIAETFNVSKSTVSSINKGTYKKGSYAN
jgi:hypothetical protein